MSTGETFNQFGSEQGAYGLNNLDGPLASAYEGFIKYHAFSAASNKLNGRTASPTQYRKFLREEMAAERRHFAMSLTTAVAAAELLKDRVYFKRHGEQWLILNNHNTWGIGSWSDLEEALGRWTPYGEGTDTYYPHYGHSGATRQILMALLEGPNGVSPITGKKVVANSRYERSSGFSKTLALLVEDEAPLIPVLPYTPYPETLLDDWERIVSCGEQRWTLASFLETPRKDLEDKVVGSLLLPREEVEIGVLDALVGFLRVQTFDSDQDRQLNLEKLIAYVDRFRRLIEPCYSPGASFYELDGMLLAQTY